MKQAFLAFACVALAAAPSINAQSPTCTPSNGLNFICGLQKPEDLVLAPARAGSSPAAWIRALDCT
jgi:hypothetical protein